MSSISITVDRYDHPSQGNNQDADALDRLLKSAYKCYAQLAIMRIPSSALATKQRHVREHVRTGEHGVPTNKEAWIPDPHLLVCKTDRGYSSLCCKITYSNSSSTCLTLSRSDATHGITFTCGGSRSARRNSSGDQALGLSCLFAATT